ncbi:OLC1v1008550C1 [Oldenlandia corymbosa var. corymbosa]|uniref:OLC1v1008550C1 n=1 Tax=Oldenlandia corymbosa var. corymbosa TaxID=529605 RepID=A0AAV1DLT6_OLDCO|nr:OLC1v1008550C1 [Oldenlandia corymbosa var. corymbosa]
MAAELVNLATSEKLSEMDWTKNIEICELVARDHRQARDVIKAIKKRLGSKNANVQLLAVNLLEMLMNNIGEPVHKQVIDTGVLPVLVKIVKKKSDLPVREKIFLLLDAAQTSVGGASGRFPQYYSAYYELVSAGVQFTQRPDVVMKSAPASHANNSNPAEVAAALPAETHTAKVESRKISDSSILQKAEAALEVLREVIDAVDTRHPEGAKDEFTLDLVEQCAFQKQRVMHLAMTSRDDKLVTQAIELNDQLERVLRRHDALVSARPTSTSNHVHLEEPEEEEEAEQLFRRIRKGKACLQPGDESPQINGTLGLLGSSGRAGMLNRPLIRPLTLEPKHDTNGSKAAASIPPPPAKHVEREKFFQDHKADGSGLANHVRGLSLHSRNASTSSCSGSMDFSNDNFH